MTKKTPLHAQHLALGAKMVDFSGWDMPLHYGSQVEEHHQVRADAGLFDVSHMTVVDVSGGQVSEYLRYLLANDVARLKHAGQGLYTTMLNEQGGVIDDLIVYRMTEPGTSEWFRLVVNCGTREVDLAWMVDCAVHFDVSLNEQPDLAMVAVQGPNARALAASVLSQSRARLIDELKPFQGQESEGWFIARTGYTGEDGLEVILPDDEVVEFWQALIAAGAKPCGLGARDTLRLEAGLNLYGADMNQQFTPLESNLAWTLVWEPEQRRFIGRDALEKQRNEGVPTKLVGLVLEGRGVLRAHQRVLVDNVGEGEVTSGGFSPTLGCSVALARVPAETGDTAQVEMRGKSLAVKVVKPPFVRRGKKQFS